jgi:hypothetical protein
MGAKIRVDKDTETQFSVTIPGDFIITNHTFLVPVDPVVAQEVKPTLGLLYAPAVLVGLGCVSFRVASSFSQAASTSAAEW